MGAWPDVATAVSELRVFLNDGPSDRPVKRKKLVGTVEGTNTQFFVFEERLVMASALPGGVAIIISIDDTDLPNNKVQVSDPLMGEIDLVDPPPSGSTVRGRYYYQYFLDSELQLALGYAIDEAAGLTDVIQVDNGFKMTVMNYAGYWAYEKQAMRWAQRMSQKFLLEEEPVQQEVLARSNMFRDIAKDLRAAGDSMRANVYKRKGRREAPAFGFYKPVIPRIAPRA